jgi:hypothetical protein
MATDALNRRLRTAAPLRQVDRLILSDADYRLFEAIERHGPLPSNYLYEFTRHLRRDRSHLQNRLTEFYNGDGQGPYLTRPPQQFASYHARYQHLVYDLAPRARHLLAERRDLRCGRPRADPFVHRLMGACVGASLELGSARAGVRYIGWGDILAHPKCECARASSTPMTIEVAADKRQHLTPDGLFGYEYPGSGFRFFAVEIDRNTESIERRNLGQSSFAAKVRGYDHILARQTYRDWWGIPNLTVLTVTTSATHAAALLRYIARESRYPASYAIAVETIFGANWRVPNVVLEHLFAEPWATPSGTRLISQP